MMRPAVIALAFACLAPAAPALAKNAPSTLSDYNIQKEDLAPEPAPRHRFFNGFATRMKSSMRGKRRHFHSGVSRHPTIRLERTAPN